MRKSLLVFFMLLSSFFVFSQNEEGHVQIMTGYYADVFDEPFARNFDVVYFGGGWSNPNTSIFGKLHYGYLTEDSYGYQYEVDYYQRLTKGLTSWWNYAYSQNENFPNHRAMFRLWQKLPEKFLISGGMKYFYFDQNLFTANAGLEKYINSFWVEGVVNVHFKEPEVRLSYELNLRTFWDDFNYIQLSFISGAMQDEPWRTGNLVSPDLNAYTSYIALSSYIGPRRVFRLRANLGVGFEEYQPDVWRNRITGGVGMVYTFKK